MSGPAIIGIDTYKEFDVTNTDYPFEEDGKMWKSVAHYFIASKFLYEDYKEKIRLEDDEVKLYELEQDKEQRTIENYEEKRPELMFNAMLLRIKYHKILQTKLECTFGKVDYMECGVYWKYWNSRILTRIRDII